MSSRDRPAYLEKLYARAACGNSRAAAIKGFCLECMGYSRKDVEKCGATECPLFPYRPYQVADEADDEVKEEVVE